MGVLEEEGGVCCGEEVKRYKGRKHETATASGLVGVDGWAGREVKQGRQLWRLALIKRARVSQHARPAMDKDPCGSMSRCSAACQLLLCQLQRQLAQRLHRAKARHRRIENVAVVRV